jgi:hypothetical protein
VGERAVGNGISVGVGRGVGEREGAVGMGDVCCFVGLNMAEKSEFEVVEEGLEEVVEVVEEWLLMIATMGEEVVVE